MAVPVLVITSALPGILLVNGQWAGEAGDAPVALPVSPGGIHRLALIPYGCQPPLAARLAFEGAHLLDEPGLECVRATGRSSGVWEILLEPPPPADTSGAMPREVSTLRVDDICFTLLDYSGLALAVEDLRAEKLLRVYTLDGLSSGKLSRLSAPEGFAEMRGKSGAGERVLLFDTSGKMLLDVTADSVIVDGGTGGVLASTALDDAAGHIVRKAYAWSAETGYDESRKIERSADRVPSTPQDAALAICQALALGLNDEADAYVSSELRAQLEGGRLRHYLGPFERCAAGGVAGGDEVCVELFQQTSPRITSGRLYAFRAVRQPDEQSVYKIDDIRCLSL